MELGKFQNQLFEDIARLINEARSFVANTSNKTITLLYWQIGKRINHDFLDNQRAEYGKQIVSELATQLSWSQPIVVISMKNIIPTKL